MANDDEALRDFVSRYSRPYDAERDTYDRPPFAADIKEGKNDPIYNAHSYHTKVPPRGIIPYILPYTEPGDLILDPFCGSGMTGVAALMCSAPPANLLAQFPELAGRVGPRRAILNDLSPAACHAEASPGRPRFRELRQRRRHRRRALGIRPGVGRPGRWPDHETAPRSACQRRHLLRLRDDPGVADLRSLDQAGAGRWVPIAVWRDGRVALVPPEGIEPRRTEGEGVRYDYTARSNRGVVG